MYIIQQWQKMSEDEQLRMITANVYKALRKEFACNSTDYFINYHGLDCLISETWLKISERLDPDYLCILNRKRINDGKQEITLVSLIYRCAKDVIRSINGQDSKHERNRVHTIIDDNGREYDYVEMISVDTKCHTETTVIIRTAFQTVLNCMDDTDRFIIECKRDGMTEREIGVIVGMSGVAIHNRIVKIRAALTVAMTA